MIPSKRRVHREAELLLAKYRILRPPVDVEESPSKKVSSSCASGLPAQNPDSRSGMETQRSLVLTVRRVEGANVSPSLMNLGICCCTREDR
jgi:hypothetical protein